MSDELPVEELLAVELLSLRRRVEVLERRDQLDWERLRSAREALISTGYFTPDQVGDDIAPRIIELYSALAPGDAK